MGEGGGEGDAATRTSISPLSYWKFYDNPFYNHTSPFHDHHHSHYIHRHNHHHKARNNMQLKAELDVERRLRRKMESLNIALARELSEERARREIAEKKLEDLSEQVARRRAEMEKLRSEVVDERRMMRVAQVLREERVHMKLLEVKLMMEEKLVTSSSSDPPQSQSTHVAKVEEIEGKHVNSGGNVEIGRHNRHQGIITGQQQQVRKEMENPHIKRGIIGHVEFPSKFIRSRSGDHPMGPEFYGGSTHPKFELQKNRLRVLLKNNNRHRMIPLGGH